MRDDLIAALRGLLVHQLYVDIPEEQIGLDDGLQKVVGLDSVGFVELRVLCERHFNVQIDDEDYTPENFSSIRRLANLIDCIQAAKRTTAA